ncbi:MAG: tRNA (adenosine(37)-N6)-threonylcarbamoyltransferase complex dimerization subunit type 1 TsaB [Pseudomonadota bacterium]
MRVLAIDTATSCGVLGLAENGRPVAELSLVSRETHSARLLPAIEWLLKTIGWTIAEIDGFGITLGPGSFTGLRVGLSTVKGFAWSLSKPVAALNSLEILTHQYREDRVTIVPMLDARRDRVFCAAYRWNGDRLVVLRPPSDSSAPEFVSALEGPVVCFGEGARKYRGAIEAVGKDSVIFAPTEYDLPRGTTAARLASEALSRGETLDIHRAEPIYLRPSEAERKRT